MMKTLLKLASICLFFCTFAVQAIPARPNQPTVVLTYHPNVMSVYWDPVNRATRYNVIQIKDGQWSSVKTVTHTVADFVGAPGSVYQYAVNACDNTSECSFDSPYSAPFQMPAKTATPTFSPGSSQQYFDTYVTINAVSGATIYYTLNGTNPSTSSAVYSQPIRLSNNITIRAMAHKPGLMYSDIGSATYTIKAPPVPGSLHVGDGNSNEVIFSYGDTTSATYYLITPYVNEVEQTPVTSNQTSYRYPASPFSTYSFTVKACNGVVCSAVSSRSAEHTYVIPPTVPTGVQMIPGPPASQMNLSWNGNIRATYYEVRKTVNGASTIENVGNVTSKTYSGNGGSTYSFEVRACNTKGCSAFSAATTPYPIPISVATPQITPPSGTYSSAQTVNISVAGGAQIRYTQDGSPVTSSSPQYTGPITVSTSQTVNAKAYIANYSGSQATSNYVIDIPVEVGTPQITPPSGTYSSPQTVSMSVSTSGAVIRYTVDGSTVNSSSPQYTGPFTVNTTRTVKARAYKSGYSGSEAVRNYVIDIPVEVGTPQFSVPAGTYSSAQTITLTATPTDAVIRYTLDGSSVTTSSAQYAAPITVSASLTLKAKAFKGTSTSAESSAAYVINAAIPDWALRTESTVTESSVPFSPYQPSASVMPGVIAAEAGVSGGQADYTIPINIVPGRAGMQPSVALSYSSRSGNGIAGMGWSLQAASAISRCGSSYATDGIGRAVTLTNSDKLCYNGSRLMLVSGTYGANGAEYALEMDNMSRIVQSGGDMANSATSFTVFEASGRALQFGSSSNGKVIPAGQIVTQQWLLQSVADVTGKNTMRYIYQHNAQAEVLLSQILYTGNASSDGKGMVEFAYQARNDKTLSYVAGGKVQQTQRLASITTSYDGTVVRQYRLGYGGVSAGSGRTLLRQITECAYFDGAVESCLAPTVFNWSEQHAGYALQYVPYAGYDAFSTITQALPRGDVNGDGSRDWNGNFVDAEDNLQATHNFELAGCYFDNHRQTYICNQADFNLDGRTDGTDETGSTLRLAITNGEGATLSASWINTGITLTGNSNSPLGRDRIEGFADFNGDGWPDLLMYRVNGSAPDYRVYLHSKNTLAPYAGSGIVVHTPALDGSPAERFATTSVQLTGDMNGDGLADLVVMNSKNRFYSYPQSMPAKVLYNSWNGSTLSFSSVNLPFAPTLHQWSYFSYFIDVNSDGLTDWIGWNDVSGLQYSLNTGKAFTPLADVSGDTSWLVSRSYHAINAVNASEEQTIYYPKYSGAFRVMDVNNDGQSELLVPGQRLIESCIIYGDMEGNRTVTKEFCGDAMYGAVRFNGNSHATSPIPAESIDESIYRYNAVQFTLTENGDLSVALVPTDLIGSATQSAAVDAYGNGLDNLMFTYGTRFNSGPEPTQRFNGSTSPLGSQYGTWINRNLGDSSSGQTMMDALVSVSDAAGKTARWNYLPLSSGQNTVDELPLYATSHDYVADNQHFHFASSMYVVSHFSQSNGTGGENQQRYAYRGAVYNHAGKGFSGFRSVIQQDMTRGIIEHADYLQKMPFTGRLQSLFKFRSSEYPGGQFNLIQGWSSDISYSNSGQDAFYVSGAEDAFEQTVQRWALNTVHKAQSGSCSVSTDPVTANEQWQCGEGQHRYSVYSAHSTTVKRDLQSKVQLSVQQTEQSSVDVYGNVLTQTQSTTDDYGVYSKTLTQVFDGSTSWPDKLSSRTVTSHAVQQRHANDPYHSTATPDTDSWVRTSFSNFHSSRQPQQVSVTTSDSSRTKTIATSFNAYGLPLTLTETADVMDLVGNWQSSSRTTTLEYGDTSARADGAFVYRTTNPALHTQVIKTSPATGLVQSSIDANNLQTQFSYDVFGRMTAQQTPGAGEVRVALDSTTYDSNAPQQAVWLQVTQQRGMPEQRVYFDMLGRDIRTAVRGFEGNWINRDKRYDAAGRIEAESQPYMQGSAPAWTLYSGFDELNRPGQKVTHDDSLSISYQYSGLSTDINAGGLQMSRTYNSQNQLMQTVDAENGITRYSYNGMGLPIVLQDANGVALYAGYNALGMKLFVSDPNQGNSQYQYNGFGELELETDASGVNKYHDYDALGRQTALKAMQGSTVKAQFAYSFDSIKKGLPTSESTGNTVRSFSYDAFSRLTSNTVQIDGEQFSQHYQYHSQSGQLLSRTYPNGLTLAYEYNDHGYVEWEKNAASGYVYRQHISQDAFGNITQANLGNGVTEYRGYNSATGWVQSLEARVGGVAVHDLNYSNYDNFGNLLAYSNGATGVSESYIYDDLHRLESQTTSAAGVSAAVSSSYDAVGNLLSKSDYGNNYQYGNREKNLGGNAGANAVRQVSKNDGSTVNFSYDNEGNLISGDGLTISYNSFKQPTQINRGTNTFNFTYGANLERLKEVRNGLTTYEIDKAYEQSSDGSWKVYLDEVAIVSHNSEDGHRIAYSHKDRLGSSITFTDHNGQVTGRRHYDAFGKPRAISGALMEPAHRPRQINFADIAGISNAGITRRGFTDHRHLDEAELIHMNGRAYDYNLGRFLSVDPFIQSPTNSQSLNPYSYGMNNPLAGTDPTGYVFVVLVPLIEIGGGALGLYGSWEAGQTIGNAINDISSGEKATSDVLMDAGKSLAVDGIMTATGTRLAKFAPKSFTDKVDRLFKNNGADSTVETRSGNAVDIGDKKAELGVVYERTNPKTGECYIGQCKSPERFEERKKEHDKKLGVKHDYKIVDRAEAGDALDIAEHNKIQEKTGGIRAKDSNAVQNKKDPVGPARQKKLGVAAPTKVTGVVAVTGKLDSIRLKELDKLKD